MAVSLIKKSDVNGLRRAYVEQAVYTALHARRCLPMIITQMTMEDVSPGVVKDLIEILRYAEASEDAWRAYLASSLARFSAPVAD